MIVQRGARDKLEKFFDLNRPLKVLLQIQGAAVYDFTCFGVDANEKLSDDRYMIFYNQLGSPKGEIVGKEISSGMEFVIKLNALPEKIQKLVFTCSIDGAGVMGEIFSHKIFLGDEISSEFKGSDFQQEKAITSLEIYRKNGVWRFNVIARGFNGGLDALLAFYGGENADETPAQNNSSPKPPPTPEKKISEPKKISLEKKIQDSAPKLISLVKPLKVELEKRNLLDVKARVGLVMDISGSMSHAYKKNYVQEIVNKILPVAIQFDDDGELDFWFYGTHFDRRPNVTMKNYEIAVPRDWKKLMTRLGGSNNEPLVMRNIIAEYEDSRSPAYVIFVTDGGIYRTGGIKRLLVYSSYMPLFWQFVGVWGDNYDILEKLDTMNGRYVDNANFFALDDFMSVSNEELYSRLLNEFPKWLKSIKNNGVLDGTAKRLRPNLPPREKSFLSKVKGLLGF